MAGINSLLMALGPDLEQQEEQTGASLRQGPENRLHLLHSQATAEADVDSDNQNPSSKRRKRKEDSEHLVLGGPCVDCGTTFTAWQWRLDDEGNARCNACGVKYMRKEKGRLMEAAQALAEGDFTAQVSHANSMSQTNKGEPALPEGVAQDASPKLGRSRRYGGPFTASPKPSQPTSSKGANGSERKRKHPEEVNSDDDLAAASTLASFLSTLGQIAMDIDDSAPLPSKSGSDAKPGKRKQSPAPESRTRLAMQPATSFRAPNKIVKKTTAKSHASIYDSLSMRPDLPRIRTSKGKAPSPNLAPGTPNSMAPPPLCLPPLSSAATAAPTIVKIAQGTHRPLSRFAQGAERHQMCGMHAHKHASSATHSPMDTSDDSCPALADCHFRNVNDAGLQHKVATGPCAKRSVTLPKYHSVSTALPALSTAPAIKLPGPEPLMLPPMSGTDSAVASINPSPAVSLPPVAHTSPAPTDNCDPADIPNPMGDQTGNDAASNPMSMAMSSYPYHFWPLPPMMLHLHAGQSSMQFDSTAPAQSDSQSAPNPMAPAGFDLNGLPSSISTMLPIAPLHLGLPMPSTSAADGMPAITSTMPPVSLSSGQPLPSMPLDMCAPFSVPNVSFPSPLPCTLPHPALLAMGFHAALASGELNAAMSGECKGIEAAAAGASLPMFCSYPPQMASFLPPLPMMPMADAPLPVLPMPHASVTDPSDSTEPSNPPMTSSSQSVHLM